MTNILETTRRGRWLCSFLLCVGLAVGVGSAGCGSESGDSSGEEDADMDVDPGDKADMSKYPSGKYVNAQLIFMPARPYELENGDLLVLNLNAGKKCVFKTLSDSFVDKEGTYVFSASKSRKYFRLVEGGKTIAKYEYKIDQTVIRVRNIKNQVWFKMPSVSKESACFTDSDCMTGETCNPDVPFQCPVGMSCSAPYTTLGLCKNCPKDLQAARGTECSEEGATCGGNCTDHCQYCASLTCEGGKWQLMEVFPDPKCRDDAENGCPSDFASANGGACSEEGRSCGGECSDHCRFCTKLICSGGTWTKFELHPDPNCKKDPGSECPENFNTANGTACTEENKSCGECPDPCRFCVTLACSEGTWTKIESAPDPKCIKDPSTGCPADWKNAEGTDCATDGLTCGNECADHCQYCSQLICSDGKWSRMEIYPDPNCF